MISPSGLGVWGFWIAIVSLVVAYPLNLLANITGPKIQNWWSLRSRRALEGRIHALESRLADAKDDAEKYGGQNEIVGKLFSFTYDVFMVLGFGMYSILAAISLGILMFLPSHGVLPILGAAVVCFMVIGFEILRTRLMRRVARRFWFVLSPWMIDDLRSAISKLKTKHSRFEQG